MKKICRMLILLGFVSLSACGTIIHPGRIYMERSDRIDYFVLGVDLMFVLPLIFPGLIMLGIDNYTGALWLSPIESDAYMEENLEPSKVRDLVFK